MARYVLPAEVAAYVQLPGRSGESRLTRLRAVYQALAELKIGYAYEPPTEEADRQVIRPPDQVLWTPRHATCLDLALVLAGGCLIAGLHPSIVILVPPGGRGALHAVLLVRLDHDVEPSAAAEAVWPTPPDGLLADLQTRVGHRPARMVAVDPVGVAVSLGTTHTRSLDVDFDDAVANGARYLTGRDQSAAWPWHVGVDIGTAWRAHDTESPPHRPVEQPLREPYRSPDDAESPLRLLRAEYAIVPFQNRDELTVLQDWCQQTAGRDRTGLAIITGIGGSGKTRIALELAHRLRSEGWYAGTLPKGATGVDWLAVVVSPVLIVLDYADGRVTDTTNLLKALRSRCGPPAAVLLTARSMEGEWLTDILSAVSDDRHPYRSEVIALPDIHPDFIDVYRRTVAALARPGRPRTAPQPPAAGRWTTLDFVLLGWMTAQGADILPATRGELYDEALRHEENYWVTVYRDLSGGVRPDRALLRKAAACLTLIAPIDTEAYRVLAAVVELADDAAERRLVRRTLSACLKPALGEGLGVRPDPLGDRLLLRVLDDDADLLHRVLEKTGETSLEQAVVTLVRAGRDNIELPVRLITALIRAQPLRWRVIFSVAVPQGGAATASLENLASESATPLPLDDISEAIPFSSISLYDLALTVDQRRLDAARQAGAEQSEIARFLQRVSDRAYHAGKAAVALTSITESVNLRRELAVANPAVFLPELVSALSDLSGRQSENGDWSRGLATATEAVELSRELAVADPAAFLPNLATSLNTLSNRQSEAGNRDGALASISEAVAIRRELTAHNSATFLPKLAGSLNDLSCCQHVVEDWDGALASISEAVEIRRKLATGIFAKFLPDLASSVNNLAVQQSQAGDRSGALTSAKEAVIYHRVLAGMNPITFLPSLARSLNTLTNSQIDVGDLDGARASIFECVTIRHSLAATDPVRFLPDLAISLHNLSVVLGDTGDRKGALTSIEEAVEIRRGLAAANPARFLPDLAMSLSNMSSAQRNAGDRGGARTTALEAVEHHRTLALANPGRFREGLASALVNLASCQQASGNRSAALESITEAVNLRRELAEGHPSAFLPDLAAALNNLSLLQSDIRNPGDGLASITEAVEIRRVLAEAHPAFLPVLATSLNNLSILKAQTGDPNGALAAVSYAVQIRDELAAKNPAHLPDLADSLQNLSNYQRGAGDIGQALTSITQAVEVRRKLNDADPAAFLPDLASALNTLSVLKTEAGDSIGGLAVITESVRHYRDLVGIDSAAFLPGLAMSLNNLSNRQGETGDTGGALASAVEAVEQYRELAARSPDYLAGVAGSLHNLATCQHKVGDLNAALASITESIKIRRDVGETYPSGDLPEMASSLNVLSLVQRDVGNLSEAIASITEAINRYRELAVINPAVNLADLVGTLENLSSYLVQAGQADELPTAWSLAIDAMRYPVARAELRAAWARCLIVLTDEVGQAWEQLRHAAREADQDDADESKPDRMSALLTMRARWAIRNTIGILSHEVFPVWATAPLPEAHLCLVNESGEAEDWPAIQAALYRSREILISPEFNTTLHVLARLSPDNPIPSLLLDVVDDINESSIDAVFQRREAEHERWKLLSAWINTTTS